MHSDQWYLNQLNITEYDVRTNKNIQSEVDPSKRLFVLAAINEEETVFFQDILSTFNLKSTDYQWISFPIPPQTQFPKNSVVWSLGQNWSSSQNRPVFHLMSSEPLKSIKRSPELKKSLWKSLIEYEHYLTS